MKINLLKLTQQQIEAIDDFELSLAAYKLTCEPLDGLKMEKAQEQVRRLPNLIRPLYTTLVLQSEVENGGFNQYFWNSSGKLASEAFDDLVSIGAKLHAALLKQAITIENKESAMMSAFKKPQTWDAFAESYKHTDLGSLDSEFYKLEKLDNLRSAHIKKHLLEIQGYFKPRGFPNSLLKL
jgi:hypothetical protein